MLKCEAGLHAFHASMRDASPQTMSRFQPEVSSAGGPRISTSGVSSPTTTLFAKVSTVVTGSPAAEAGLKVGDRIRRFGEISWRNHEKLSKIAELVGRSEGVSD